jgi:hypothetical protein
VETKRARIITTSLMILLLALPLSAFADDWPYPSDPMTWDANDPNPPTNELGIYYMSQDGFNLPIKTVASDPTLSYDIEILDLGSPQQVVAEQHISPTLGEIQNYIIPIPKGTLGTYEIRTKGTLDITDRFMVVEFWPYEALNAVGYDSADVFGDFTNGGYYYPGDTVTIKATARWNYNDDVVIDVYGPDGIIASNNFGGLPETTDEFDVYLAPDAKQGLYEIKANGLTTDFFTVCTGVPPVPEMPTIALLSLGFVSLAGYIVLSRRKSR